MTRILIAEDDIAISDPLARALRREGYDVTVVVDGHDAYTIATAEPLPDLLLLDVGLPELDGLEVCRSLREGGSPVPVLMLTARADEVDKVIGLDVGADDYVTKPFQLAELLARVRAHLRRGPRQVEKHTAEGAVRLNENARQVFVHGQEVQLTNKEFDLLRVLMREEGQVVSRGDLLMEIWKTKFASTKTVDMHVSVLRRKLGDDTTDPKHIITVRGIGFRFENHPVAAG